jgi:hypothetical protein
VGLQRIRLPTFDESDCSSRFSGVERDRVMATLQPDSSPPRRLCPLDRPAPSMDSVAKDGSMASLSRRIMKFMQSPQGQQLIEQANVRPASRRTAASSSGCALATSQAALAAGVADDLRGMAQRVRHRGCLVPYRCPACRAVVAHPHLIACSGGHSHRGRSGQSHPVWDVGPRAARRTAAGGLHWGADIGSWPLFGAVVADASQAVIQHHGEGWPGLSTALDGSWWMVVPWGRRATVEGHGHPHRPG